MDSVAGHSARTGFTRLILTNFRSYARMDVRLNLSPVVLTGANGAGKTNVLEALSMLSPGRGMRQAQLSDLRKHGGDGPWAVATRLWADGDEVALGTGLVPGEGERRNVHIDGTTSGPGALSDYLRMTWLTPAMDRLFSEAASGRRRFLDRLTLLLHPYHSRTITAYEKAMRERNALLDASPHPDPNWAAALESQMADHGIAIAAARCDMVHSLNTHIKKSPEGSFPKAFLALEGDVERDLDQGLSAVAAEDAFKTRLAQSRALDAAAKRTLTGPHRSDLMVTHQDKNMPASQCSTGEQKALLIGLILAHADLSRTLGGPAPILLLDEIAAHLDRLRRAALFERLCAMPAQCWLTGTDAELFEAMEGYAQFFTVFDGSLHHRD